MPKGEKQRFKLYYLAKIMLEKTDDTHFLSMPEIIAELEKYGVGAERKSVYNDMKDLEELGIEIKGEQNGRSYHYHVLNHPFDLAELKLLVDVIQASRFITEKKTKKLIRKLEGYVSIHEAKQLQRQVYVSGRIKTMNESIYYNVDTIHNAITRDKKISFQYFQWNVKKEMERRHNGAYYHISPWGLIWDNENYYMIGYDSKAGILKNYRVDKMLDIRLLKEDRDGKDQIQKLNLAAYATASFGMFGGEDENVKLLVKNSYAGIIIDRFGKDIMMIPATEDHFTINVRVKMSDQFLSWVSALGDGAKIIGPEPAVERMHRYVERLKKQYGL